MKWQHVDIDKVVTIQKGRKPNIVGDVMFDESPLPYVTIEAFENKKAFQYASIESNSVLTENGDVVIVWDGARFGLVGYSIQGVLGSTLAKLTTNKQLLEKNFLKYYLSSKLLYLQSNKRGSGIPHLDSGTVNKLKIPLPPTSEQRRIIEILEQADVLCTKRLRAEELTEKILPMLFYDMFGDPNTNPMQWKKTSLGEIIQIGTQLVEPGQKEYADLIHIGGENIESHTGRIINTKSVRESELRSAKFIFNDNHVLYCKIRPYLNKVVYPRFPGLCSADIYPLLPDRNNVLPLFLVSLLRSNAFQRYASIHSQRLRMPKLNSDQLASFSMIVPPLEIQHRFSLKMEQCLQLEKNQRQQGENLKTLYKSLSYQAFSGDLTSKWREAHMKELLQEMEEQIRELKIK